MTDEFTWEVDETEVPEGYTKTVRSEGYNFIIANTYEDNPKTGDFTNLVGFGAMALVGFVGMVATVLAMIAPRKKEEQ